MALACRYAKLSVLIDGQENQKEEIQGCKKGRKKTTSKPAAAVSTEDRRSEATTVGWMLAFLATLVTIVAAILIRGFTLIFPVSDRIALLADWLLLSAFISGIVTLIMTPLTLKFRRVPPPEPIVIMAVAVSCIPLIIVLTRMLAAWTS